MPVPVLATKLYIPPPQPNAVRRSRLVERLNAGLHRKLTLISAPAGFGKTTLVREWVASCGRPVAWLSLDEDDRDPNRWLTYLIAAMQTVSQDIGEGLTGTLQSPQPPPIETPLTALLNDIAAIPDAFVLVLDDYHVIDAKPVDDALTFLIEHLPPHVHLVITTREDPRLPLPRLRARGQLTELRAADLRFTHSEAAEFLNQTMGLNLSEQSIAALEARTEGWIAGLQLAAISMQGHDDVTGFIASFTGSHRYVLDYLVEEVLNQQSEQVQAFLLRTSILSRFCGPLTDAVLLDGSMSGQETLEYLEHVNLFIVPLDNERRWYRYHHLFAELLRQRLLQHDSSASGDAGNSVADLHIRASAWFEEHGLDLEAFQHAVAANDVERAERLIEGDGIPLSFRNGPVPVLNWLESLPAAVLDARPSLYTTYASVLLVTGKTIGVERLLQAADAALDVDDPDERTRDLIGRNAAVWATLAANLKQTDAIMTHSHRALEYLHPDNLAFRTSTMWKMGYAYLLQGKRDAARQAFMEVMSELEASGSTIFMIVATIGLASIQLTDIELVQAAETYERALKLLADQPLPVAGDARLGLGHIYYAWNDLDTAYQHGQASLQFALQRDNNDRLVACQLFLASLKRAEGDLAGSETLVEEAAQSARQHSLESRMPEVAAAQVRILLDAGRLAEARQLAGSYNLPISQARVQMAKGDAAAALEILEPVCREFEARGWVDERLNVLVLQALAYPAYGDGDTALHLLGEALTLAEPGGIIRLFVDEGAPMAQLLSDAIARGINADYASTVLAAFDINQQSRSDPSPVSASSDLTQPLIEPLSSRELEVLRLIAQGLSNREIADRLFLALNTVKGHNRVIFGKLQVQRRTEAVARARELDLL